MEDIDGDVPAETVELSRVSGSHIAPVARLADLLKKRGVDPAIVDVLAHLAQKTSVEVCTDNSNLLPLSTAADA